MTTSQLDHLRAIDAHLDKLLAIAAKRTPGEWAGEYELVAQIIPNQSEFGALICEGESYPNMDFIAACANNAEAGWRSTKAAIECGIAMGGFAAPMLEAIIAEWPLETLKP